MTNWDPALSQKVLSADIAKYPKIDVIVSDFGPSLVGALPEFTKNHRSIPALATSDGNVLGCFWKKNVAKNPSFKLYTVSTQTTTRARDRLGGGARERWQEAGDHTLPEHRVRELGNR